VRLLEICIIISQSLPNTLELESEQIIQMESFLTYASLVTNCRSIFQTNKKGLCNTHLFRREFQVEIYSSTPSLGIYLSAHFQHRFRRRVQDGKRITTLAPYKGLPRWSRTLCSFLFEGGVLPTSVMDRTIENIAKDHYAKALCGVFYLRNSC